MFEKELLFGNDARSPILEGARKAAMAVIATLGPLGRNVVIRRRAMTPPLITKDGVSVAKEIKAFSDPFEDIGLQMIKEAASRTNDSAGDGTTTATLLAFEMMKEGLQHIKSGSNAIHIRRGMQKASDAVVKKLDEIKTKVEGQDQFQAIAKISSQDDEIGALVALVIQEIGNDGAVTVEAGQAIGMNCTFTEGMQLSSGYASENFRNKKDKLLAVIENPYILITDERITSVEQLVPVISIMHPDDQSTNTLVIIAESIENEALNVLVINLPWIKVQGQRPEDKANLVSLAIRAPEIGERRSDILQDIAIKTGGRVVSKKVGLTLNSVALGDFGRAERIISSPKVSTIINGAGKPEDVQARADSIKQAIEATQDADEADFLRGRLANLTGHIAVISVGASSEVEQKEKQHRVEDAIAAVRAASEEGIVPGGGSAYLEAREAIKELDLSSDDEKTGADIVYQTLQKPLWWIATNAGYENGEAEKIIAKVMKLGDGQGFNAETGQYVQMIESNIIDPKKVSRCALENAVSVAGAFLTVEVGIVDSANQTDKPLPQFQQ